MNEDAWPSRERAPERTPLPRAEDLPVAENGYERDAVHAAFDAFYRHTAQLDATLRTLEAVDTFTRQAAELRADLRTLRSAGLGPQPWSSPYSTPSSERAGVSPAVPRIAIELAFVIAVPVVAGAIGHFDSSIVLAVTLAAWALTALIELVAYRSRISPPVVPRVVPGEPAAAVVEPEPAAEPFGWGVLDDEPEGALTMIAPAVEVEEPAVEEPVAVIEPPTPEPTFPAPPAAPIVEPPAPEPTIAPPEPEPTFPSPAPEPMFPPEQPEPAPDEPEPPPQPVAESGDSPRPRRSLFRRSVEPAAESELEPEVEAVALSEHEPEPEREPEPTAEEQPKRRLFGRRRAQEAEPLLEAEPELEPEQAYVDPWERDFEYNAPGESENAVEVEETPPEETTQEPLAAERSELEPDEGDSNGTPPGEAEELPVSPAPRRPEYVPRRGRRR